MNEVLQNVLAHWWREGGKKKRGHTIVGTRSGVERAGWWRHLTPGVERSGVICGKDLQRPQPSSRFLESRWRAQREGGGEEGKGCQQTRLRTCHDLSVQKSFPGPCSSAGRSRCRFPEWLFQDDAPRARTWISRWLAAVCFMFRDHFGKDLFCILSFEKRSGVEGPLFIRRVSATVRKSLHPLGEGSHFPKQSLCWWVATAVRGGLGLFWFVSHSTGWSVH